MDAHREQLAGAGDGPGAAGAPSLPLTDLHAHSTASDGALAPTDLMAAAAAAGVARIALTDHDTTAGLAEAARAAPGHGVALIAGVEVSATWRGSTLHVLGLGIDPADVALQAGLAAQRQARIARAERIQTKLRKLGFAAAAARVEAGIAPTRAHFAAALVAEGDCTDFQSAFDRYLGRGRPAYESGAWSPLATVVAWITGAGGHASIAHPLRYKLSGGALRALCTEFGTAGGAALEVVTGQADRERVGRLSALARDHGLAATRGSDFHGPGAPWSALGRLSPLPKGTPDLAERLVGASA